MDEFAAAKRPTHVEWLVHVSVLAYELAIEEQTAGALAASTERLPIALPRGGGAMRHCDQVHAHALRWRQAQRQLRPARGIRKKTNSGAPNRSSGSRELPRRLVDGAPVPAG